MEQEKFVKAKPEILPQPTYTPFLLALSFLFIGWGLLTSWVIAVGGGGGLCFAIYGWIKQMLYERENNT